MPRTSGDGHPPSKFKANAELLRMLMLRMLQDGPNYPTGLAKDLRASGIELNEAYASTLMADLKTAGLASSKLVFSAQGRPRRMYSLTSKGREQAPQLIAQVVQEYRAALAILGAE